MSNKEERVSDLIVGTHPYADKFPMLSDADLDELAESIAAIGLINPIVIDPAGLILDGRNRLEACNRAEVEAITTVYEGSDVAEFVIGCNVTRRNMSTGARAMATALVLEADGRRKDGKWDGAKGRPIIRDGLVTNSFAARLKECGVVLDFKPDLAPAVVAGSVTLNDAFTQAEKIRTSDEREKIMKREKAKREKAEAAAEAQRNAEIIADLTQAGATKYLDLIDSKAMTPKAAWAAYREDTRKDREREEQEQKARSQMFGRIADALLTLGSWGEYDDPTAVMAQYNPGELNPPMLSRYFDLANLQAAHRMTAALIDWSKK
jgi:hypothetical protein